MTTVKPYVWNKGKHDEQLGARIRNRDTGGYVFVPLGDMIHISNVLIDLVEQHENENTVKREAITNDVFDRLADN